MPLFSLSLMAEEMTDNTNITFSLASTNSYHQRYSIGFTLLLALNILKTANRNTTIYASPERQPLATVCESLERKK